MSVHNLPRAIKGPGPQEATDIRQEGSSEGCLPPEPQESPLLFSIARQVEVPPKKGQEPVGHAHSPT